jgi:hypothetical protein
MTRFLTHHNIDIYIPVKSLKANKIENFGNEMKINESRPKQK